MLIKEGYQRRNRLNQLPRDEELGKTNKQTQASIGSIKNKKINYLRSDQFFSKDYIPEKAQQAKSYIKQSIDPDILQLKPRKWNSSVEVPKRFQQQESHSRKLLKIRKGILDCKSIKASQKKIYEGTDTRNDYNNWNISVFHEANQRAKDLYQTNMDAFNNSVIYTSKKLKKYLRPIERFELNETARKQLKQQDQNLSTTLQMEHKLFNPNASPENTKAYAFRLLEEIQRNRIKPIKQDSPIQKYHFRASLSPTQKLKVHTEWYHNGIWQCFKDGSNQQQWGWSCCMNQQKDSKGCNKRVLDGNKLNFSSFTHE